MTISYAEDQQEDLKNVAIVFLTFSIICFFITTYWIFVYYRHKFPNPTIPKLVMFISGLDVLRCVLGVVFTIRYINDQNDIENVGLCSTLGFMCSFYECLTHLVTFLIPLITYRSLTHSIKSFEPKAYLCCLLVTIVISSIPFFFLDGGYQPVDGGMICFIKNDSLRIFCVYVPFVVTFVGSLIFIDLIHK